MPLLGQPLFQVLAYAATLFIVIGGLKAAAGLVVQILVALFLAIITTPLFAWMRHRRIPVPVALTAMLVLAFGAMLVLFMISQQTASAIIRDVPFYQERAVALMRQAETLLERWDLPFELPEETTTLNMRAVLAPFAAALQGLTSGVGVVFIVGILVVFL